MALSRAVGLGYRPRVPATVSVPLNTIIADLDAALRRLLEGELADHGFGGARVSFDAPTSQWSAGLTVPTVDLFLYDLREASDVPGSGWSEHRGNGPARLERPALRLECSYAVTAWTRETEDEHRLLSQTLAVLLAHTRLPDRILGERLAEVSAAQGPIMTRIGQPKADHKAEFWTAVGGRYRVSLDYVVTLSIVPGVTFERGPEVRTHIVRVGDRRARTPQFEQRHRCGGIVRSTDGQPVADAWLVLPAIGAWASSGPDGRFSFAGVPKGTHRCDCRAPGGAVAAADLVVPGPGVEITVAAP
jgi:Pvc16 N-terminal domain